MSIVRQSHSEECIKNRFVTKTIEYGAMNSTDHITRNIIENKASRRHRGNIPKFIENFLKNRSFQVKVGSTLSDPYVQEEGVPQGSILSPLLFEIKINSITKTLKSDINSSLYVDDFLICYKSRGKIDSIERQLQQQLKILEEWANQNGF